MSRARDGMNLAKLTRMLGGRPPREAADQPLQTAAAGAGGGSNMSFEGSIPSQWTGEPGNHPGTRSMRVVLGAGTWGIQVVIFSIVSEEEVVHKTFNLVPMITKVCIDGAEGYRCILMDPTTDAVEAV